MHLRKDHCGSVQRTDRMEEGGEILAAELREGGLNDSRGGEELI